MVHFEIPTDDIERSKKFYNDLFGWSIEKWPGREACLLILLHPTYR
ncbi:MAG: VOC family protein [Nitrososphaeraceae archaeon]